MFIQKITRLNIFCKSITLFCIFLASLIFVYPLKSQNKKIDSLLTQLKKEKFDTNKVKCLISLSSKYSYQNPDSAIFFAEQAKEISERINNKKFLAISFTELGWNTNQLGLYPQAIDYYLKAIKLNEELDAKDELSIAFGSIGTVYKDQANFPKALDCFFKALKIAEDIGDKKLNWNLAWQYRNYLFRSG